MSRIIALLAILAVAALTVGSILVFCPDSSGRSMAQAWWYKKTRQQQRTMIVSAYLLVGLLLLGGVFSPLLIDMFSSGTTSSGTRSLSVSTQRKIFYDIIATQDQNPYSNEWNQEVKQAAANHYNVPMSQINDIIRRGAVEGWLQPDPP